MSTGTAESTTITQSPSARVVRVVEDTGPNCYLLDTGRFEHMQRIATLMSSASLIPEHLKLSKSGPLTPQQVMGNCFLIVNQAIRWGLDPFAVAPETYVVGGKLGFQGKLIAALVNARAGLADRLNYTFAGRGDDLTITVAGRFEDEDQPRTITLRVGDAKTQNQMWTKDPEQKLVYSGATKWARRHCPEIILGVLTDDDLERMQEQTRVVEARVVGDSRAASSDLNERLSRSDQLARLLADGDRRATESEAKTAHDAAEGSQDDLHIADRDEMAARMRGAKNTPAAEAAQTGTAAGETNPSVESPGEPAGVAIPPTTQAPPAVPDTELIDENTYLDHLEGCDTLAAVDRLSFDFLKPERMPDAVVRNRCVDANRKRKDQIRTAAQMKKDAAK